MDKAIITMMLIIAGIVCVSVMFNSIYPALNRGSDAVVSMASVVDDRIKSLILKTSDANAIKHRAIEQGMVTLRRDGALKVLKGVTSVEEVFRVTQQ